MLYNCDYTALFCLCLLWWCWCCVAWCADRCCLRLCWCWSLPMLWGGVGVCLQKSGRGRVGVAYGSTCCSVKMLVGILVIGKNFFSLGKLFLWQPCGVTGGGEKGNAEIMGKKGVKRPNFTKFYLETGFDTCYNQHWECSGGHSHLQHFILEVFS